MKKITTAILAFVFIMGVFCMPASANLELFSDVAPGHWSYDAINQLNQAGLITGYGDGTFRGDRNITRYEMAVLVAGAMNKMDKASPENKALIEKLGAEYAGELEQLGIRLAKVEDKVNKFDINGHFRMTFGHVNNDVENNDKKSKGSIWSGRLLVNVTNKIDDKTTAYLRFGGRDCWGDDDLSTTSAWAPEQMFYSSVDQYGVKINNDGWEYTLGKQPLTLGQGLLISNGTDIEWSNHLLGVTARGKIGATNTTLVAGWTTDSNHLSSYGASRARWLGADFTGKISPAVTLGGTYVSHKAQKPDIPNPYYTQATDARDMWAVNTMIQVAPHIFLLGEYAESDYDEDNKAFNVGAMYAKGRDTVVVSKVDVEKYSIDHFNSNYSSLCTLSSGEGFFHNNWWANMNYENYNAWRFYWKHQMNKNVYWDIFAVDAKVDYTGGSDREYYLGLNYAF
ncbi:S-layer homology domain-containing protein [Sporomusa sphaeroides]|uniref:S-layer homology domain-containing protein n=1 Tax=Sporomusa sphaeroides TaxID=47679 RepID=UPI002C80C0E7|nr:S-layer homology domain-containing protein [Sporomusa sphaeroides]HML31826.1 S-layer homology domain-containing protein [Sporomusa sphaeroides]